MRGLEDVEVVDGEPIAASLIPRAVTAGELLFDDGATQTFEAGGDTSYAGLVWLLALAGSWVALLVGALRRRRLGADCALVATGLLGWQLIDFFYADIGGPSTVLMSVVLGLAAWWALAEVRRA